MRFMSFRPQKIVGTLALGFACIVASLNTAHAKLDLFGDLPIIEAVRDSSLEETKTAIIDGASVHSRTADGTPVIVLAAAARNLDIVKLLIENGARPDDRSKKDGASALTLAAANGDLEIVAHLLDHKADIDLPGALGETALIKATRGHHNSVIKILIERGASVEETDASGTTALEIAQRAGWKDTEALFKTKKAGSK